MILIQILLIGALFSCLDINVFKTKEMIIDFRKNPTVLSPVVINCFWVDYPFKKTEFKTEFNKNLASKL